MNMAGEKLISAQGLGKKYCKSLKRSMIYGVQDIVVDIFSRSRDGSSLREDEFWSVRDVSFDLNRGECLGIVGANGAGKSTLLKLIDGIFHPDEGCVTTVNDMGALIEVGAGFHPMLTGRENIFINAAIMGYSKQRVLEKFEEIVEFSELAEFIDMPVKNYSSGMHVRLGFSIAVCLCPSALLLDEVLAVGDIKFSQKCFSKIRALLEEDVGVILVSHSLNDLLRITSRLIVLDKGAVVYSGPTEKGLIEYQRYMGSSGEPDGFQSKGLLQSIDVFGNDDKTKISQVETNQDLCIEFTLNPAARHSNLEVRLVIDSPLYGPIAVVNSRTHDIQIDACGGERRYGVRVKKVPFLRGSYQLHVHFFDEHGVYLGGEVGAGSIEVDSSELGSLHRHLITLDREWYLR